MTGRVRWSLILGATLVCLGSVAAQAQETVTLESLKAQIERLTRTTLEQEQQLRRMDGEVRSLRGEAEVLNHQIEQNNQSQRNLYADMDERLRKVESGAPTATLPSQPMLPPLDPGVSLPPVPAAATPALPPPTATSPTPALPTPPAAAATTTLAPNEKAAYEQCFAQLQGGDYAGAIQSFQTFLRQYPAGNYADNAQYWLAEAFYAQRDYQSALREFNTLLETYPNSKKRPDALLKTGYVYHELKDRVMARRILENVRSSYPNTPVARLAEQRLRSLQAEGY